MEKLFGMLFSFIGLILLMAIFNSGNNTPIAQWPTEGFFGMVFTIGWLTPLPDTVVYIIAILLIVLVAVLFYKLGQWLYRKLFIRVELTHYPSKK